MISMKNKNILIIGAGSGLGKHLTTKFKNSKLFVTYNTNKPLENYFLKYKLNLGIEKELVQFCSVLNSKKIIFDLIYFIGAITPNYEKETMNCTFSGKFSQKTFNKFIKINCFAPSFIFQQLYQNNLIHKNAKVIFFSSLAGSISNRGKLKHNLKGGNHFYRISKSALNSAVKNISYDLDHTNIKIVCLHPGWIRTESGGEDAELSIEHAVENIINFTVNINKNHHGGFYFSDGNKIDW